MNDINKLPPDLIVNHLRLLRIIDKLIFREEKRRDLNEH